METMNLLEKMQIDIFIEFENHKVLGPNKKLY